MLKIIVKRFGKACIFYHVFNNIESAKKFATEEKDIIFLYKPILLNKKHILQKLNK